MIISNKNICFALLFLLSFLSPSVSADSLANSKVLVKVKSVVPLAETTSLTSSDSSLDRASDSTQLDSAIVFTPGTKEWKAHQLRLIAGNNEEDIELATKELISQSNNKDYDFLKALSNGEVYLLPNHSENFGLVIAGEEVENEEGDYLFPLFECYPKKSPILKNGKQLQMLGDDLIEVESNRSIRGTIQQYLDDMNLFHSNNDFRRIASESIGNQGDSSSIPLLKKSIKMETNKSILRLKKLSLAKIELKVGSDMERLNAVKILEELKSPLGIPALEARIKKDSSGTTLESNERIKSEINEALASLTRFEFFTDIFQTGFIGLSLGSILILVSLGLAIIYGLMGVINMAHGEFMMIGAYATYEIQNLFMKYVSPDYFDLFFIASLPFAFLVSGCIGLLMEMTIIRKLYKRPLESLLATWGISFILIQMARTIYGDLTAVKLPTYLQGGFEVAPQVIFPYTRLFIIALTIVIIIVLFIIFYRTTFGLKLRSVTQNRTMSSCMGIQVRKVDAMTFFLGTGIAGIAGWAMTLIGNVVPNMGQTYIVDSFLVVVTGGVGNLLGTVSAGLGIGVLNKILEPIFQAVYGKVIILGLIILFLQIKPKGLFPNKGRGLED